jgi:nicotinic acid mononucleotide adenylyltransferase
MFTKGGRCDERILHHFPFHSFIVMDENLEPGSNATLASARHPSKHLAQSCSTDDGMQIDESDEQRQNAYSSIRDSREPDSNVTLESAEHRLKHLSQSCSTDDGMQIDENDEQSSHADSSMRESLETDSNVTLETNWFS